MRDRLPPDLAAHLGAQLPWWFAAPITISINRSPEKTRSLDAFLAKIADELKFNRPVNTKDALQVVCSVLMKHVDDGQIAKVWEALPQDITQGDCTAAFLRSTIARPEVNKEEVR
jgi:uncharacterized protein (DUF2267 family)